MEMRHELFVKRVLYHIENKCKFWVCFYSELKPTIQLRITKLYMVLCRVLIYVYIVQV